MIVKRLGAIAIAVVLILGALLIRDRVIDDDGGSGNDDPTRADREIVCVSDLREACNALADAREDLDIRIEDAGATLDALAALKDPLDAPIWVTMAPLPEMVDSLRTIRGAPELGTDQTPVASSPIALVVPDDRAAVLAAACGTPLEWVCVGAAAADPWEDIGGVEAWETVRPAFAPIESAIGLLGVAEAVLGYFGPSPIQPNDPDFVSWARRLANAVPAGALSGGTAIVTIETRTSALDVAVGPAAEFSDPPGKELGLQYADPMIRVDVVVAVPDGASLPNGLDDDLVDLLVTEGRWEPPSHEPKPPAPTELLTIREAWKAFL